jgi:S-adenosyl-L-methionine hydrolase (adenosine-forming)
MGKIPNHYMTSPSGIVTLLTDFGTEDVYGGVMKGVILQINPAIAIVDLTHQIPPQNVALGSFQLQNAYRHFPPGTVHLAVVDPGVGSTRNAIAIAAPTGFFVGPDNGIFSGILADAWIEPNPSIQAITLDNPRYWYAATPSKTFHGRDIFAAIAAHLASGIPLSKMGMPIAVESLTTLDLPPCQPTATGLQAHIQAIDRFGNGISTISADAVHHRDWSVTAAGQIFPHYSIYSEADEGSPLSLIGSHYWIELAVSRGNAQQIYGLALGDRIELTWR